jgi:hypothetical protein
MSTANITEIINFYPFVEVVGMQDGAEQVKSVGRNGTSLSKALANLSAVSSSGMSLLADLIRLSLFVQKNHYRDACVRNII